MNISTLGYILIQYFVPYLKLKYHNLQYINILGMWHHANHFCANVPPLLEVSSYVTGFSGLFSLVIVSSVTSFLNTSRKSEIIQHLFFSDSLCFTCFTFYPPVIWDAANYRSLLFLKLSDISLCLNYSFFICTSVVECLPLVSSVRRSTAMNIGICTVSFKNHVFGVP